MRNHPVGLVVWFLVGPFVYFHTSCGRTAKALARLRIRAVLPEPSLAGYVISTIISWAGSIFDLWHLQKQDHHNLKSQLIVIAHKNKQESEMNSFCYLFILSFKKPARLKQQAAVATATTAQQMLFLLLITITNETIKHTWNTCESREKRNWIVKP